MTEFLSTFKVLGMKSFSSISGAQTVAGRNTVCIIELSSGFRRPFLEKKLPK